MSDILIKNIELPKYGESLHLYVHGNGLVFYENGNWPQLAETKAIELPEHGDLIDIDLAIEDFAEKHCRHGACMGKACKDCDYYYVIGFFKTSIRKVLEASE